MCVRVDTNCVCVCTLYELGFVVGVCGEKPYGSVLSLRREPQRWGTELVHRSGHLERYPSESTSPKMVYSPSLFFFHPSSSILSFASDLPDPYYFHIPGRSVCLKEGKQVLHLSCKTLGNVTGREVKCVVGTVSVCEMGVLCGRMGHFSSLENKHLR